MTEKNNITCAFIVHYGRYVVYIVGVFLMEEIQLILAKNLKDNTREGKIKFRKGFPINRCE